MNHFPKDFAWGVATAAPQIEGAWNEGAKGLSIWDTFSRRPGAVQNADTLDIACDHYHRFPEDIKLMKELGVRHYRLSLSWPRILPQGRGPVNPEGVAFYRTLLTALREAGIRPLVTLYHWDLPQPLEDAGGWPSRGIVDAFVRYAEVCFEAFGDLVDDWTTFNEPWVFAFLGYGMGVHAPGRRVMAEAYQASHHLLVAHGLTVRAFRRRFPQGRIGLVVNAAAGSPRTPGFADEEAVRLYDLGGTFYYVDPILRGGYDPEVAQGLRSAGLYPVVEPGDFELIRGELDFLGVNYYFDQTVWSQDSGMPGVAMGPSEKRTAMGWSIRAEGLAELLGKYARRYPGLDLYITENGSAWDDAVVEGRVDDPERTAYLEAHLAQAARAIEAGVPLKGYYAWSLLDNFEWAEGYAKRFGLVHVDFATQRRIIKASGRRYAQIIAQNGL